VLFCLYVQCGRLRHQVPRGGVEIAAGEQRLKMLLADTGVNELAEFKRSEFEQMARVPQGILKRSEAALGDPLDAR
jgi:hypothetical protein